MTNSPYYNQPIANWGTITDQLIANYPIAPEEILDIANRSWDNLWTTQVGDIIDISRVELPATVVGYFFQKLFAYELAQRYPTQWKGEGLKSDKDLVNLSNALFSTEMKSSGQLGYRLFGNRSYNQQLANDTLSSKGKSGYYITLNFYGQKMTLLRIGWIDQEDWIPQGAQTGQAAILKPEVYEYKLKPICGDYIKHSPIELLSGVGKRTISYFHSQGVYTFQDVNDYKGNDSKILSIKQKNLDLLTL